MYFIWSRYTQVLSLNHIGVYTKIGDASGKLVDRATILAHRQTIADDEENPSSHWKSAEIIVRMELHLIELQIGSYFVDVCRQQSFVYDFNNFVTILWFYINKWFRLKICIILTIDLSQIKVVFSFDWDIKFFFYLYLLVKMCHDWVFNAFCWYYVMYAHVSCRNELKYTFLCSWCVLFFHGTKT